MHASLKLTALALVAASFALVAPAPHAIADDDAPAKPKIDCKKPENKNKKACKPSRADMTEDEIVNAAYWLARESRYQEALDLLTRVSSNDNYRALTAKGFATRKLGNVDAALPLYARALELKPDYVQAREYLGEAYLSKGDLASAKGELNAIAGYCGTSCVTYTKLKAEIDAFAEGQQG